MSVSAVSSPNNRSEISPSADPPEESLRGLDLTVAELVKDKIFRVIYYIPLIGRITQNYFKEQKAKINYCSALYIVKVCYLQVIEYVKNSDAERATISAELANSFAEEFAKIAATIPKDDKKFAQKVDLDVGAVSAFTAVIQKAVDKGQDPKINYSVTLCLVKISYRKVIEYVEKSDAEHATISAKFTKSFAEQFAKIAATIPKDDKKFAQKVDLDVENAWALVTAAQEAVYKMKKGK